MYRFPIFWAVSHTQSGVGRQQFSGWQTAYEVAPVLHYISWRNLMDCGGHLKISSRFPLEAESHGHHKKRYLEHFFVAWVHTSCQNPDTHWLPWHGFHGLQHRCIDDGLNVIGRSDSAAKMMNRWSWRNALGAPSSDVSWINFGVIEYTENIHVETGEHFAVCLFLFGAWTERSFEEFNVYFLDTGRKNGWIITRCPVRVLLVIAQILDSLNQECLSVWHLGIFSSIFFPIENIHTNY